MNNKFIKRVAAVVLGVAVLSTCAFATTLDNASCDGAELTFEYMSGADKVSYIAYAATIENDDYVLGDIVAIGQIGGSESGSTEEVKVSADLLGDATHIVIRSGDSNVAGVTQKPAAISVISVEDFTYAATTEVEMITVEFDDVTYVNVPSAGITLTKNVEEEGTFVISNLNITIDGNDRDFSMNFETPAVEGAYTLDLVNVYILGAPAGDVTIVPTVNFVPVQ